jgi:hypothetical protein
MVDIFEFITRLVYGKSQGNHVFSPRVVTKGSSRSLGCCAAATFARLVGLCCDGVRDKPLIFWVDLGDYMAVCQNLVPLVNIKIAGKWMFIPLKMVLIHTHMSFAILTDWHIYIMVLITPTNIDNITINTVVHMCLYLAWTTCRMWSIPM